LPLLLVGVPAGHADVLPLAVTLRLTGSSG